MHQVVTQAKKSMVRNNALAVKLCEVKSFTKDGTSVSRLRMHSRLQRAACRSTYIVTCPLLIKASTWREPV